MALKSSVFVFVFALWSLESSDREVVGQSDLDRQVYTVAPLGSCCIETPYRGRHLFSTMGAQEHELSIFPGSWKGSTFHCSPLVIRWLLAYWAARDSHHYNIAELPWNQVKKSLFLWKRMVTYCFPELAYFMGWMLTILIFNFRGGNINLLFVSHLYVA